MLALGFIMAACRPGEVLSVPPPSSVETISALQSQSGAELAFTGAEINLFVALAGSSGGGGLLKFTSLLTDEFTWSNSGGGVGGANIDARTTAWSATYFGEEGDAPLEAVLSARSQLLIAITGLQTFEPPGGKPRIGEAYALVGYSELFLAEDYCAGVPLSEAKRDGGITYGVPTTTDSLLGIAAAHFDSALAYAGNDDTVSTLASVGLGRSRLDSGNFAAAAAAVNGVPFGFVYNIQLAPSYSAGNFSPITFYSAQLSANYGCGALNVSDREGTNGLPYLTAQDPRLVFTTTANTTCDGGTWYYPLKFANAAGFIPLATGVEAALIAAEADLHANPSQWLTDLNALRAAAPSTYLNLSSAMTPLADPGSDTGRVSVMFQERAFWLFGTGTRLGDLRRLVRQYGRPREAVYPTGTYANGENPSLPSPLPNYGTDVDLTLPTVQGQENGAITPTTDPYYKGCLVPTDSA